MAYLAGENKPRIADVIAAADVRLIKIPIAALERASEMCRLNFDRSFLRVLVERLTLANSRLTGT
jgi:CRP-like cAMP-binding protein